MLDENENPDDSDIFFNARCCKYYDLDDISKCFNPQMSLYVLNVNIRSARKNFDTLFSTLESYKVYFPIIVLTESWVRCESEWMPVPGYEAFHSIRPDRMGGGVTILVNTNFKATCLKEMCINNDNIECCSVTFNNGGNVYTILGVYRAPNVSINDFNAQLSLLIENNNIQRSKCVIAGDMNINLGRDLNSAENEYVCLLNSVYFVPVISLPTRVTNTTASIVDHIWTNVLHYDSGVITTDITDHFLTYIALPFPLSSDTQMKKSYRIHSQSNIESFCNHVENFINSFTVNFGNLDFDLRCSVFCNELFRIYNDCFPIITKYFTHKRLNNPWLTDSLINSIKFKHFLFKNMHNICGEQYYKRYRNTLTNCIRNAKALYYRNKFASVVNDSKKTWKTVKELLFLGLIELIVRD